MACAYKLPLTSSRAPSCFSPEQVALQQMRPSITILLHALRPRPSRGRIAERSTLLHTQRLGPQRASTIVACPAAAEATTAF